MRPILAVPDLNDTQFVEAVRAKVGPKVLILAMDDARVHTAMCAMEPKEPPTIKEIEIKLIELSKPASASRRGRRFANYNYHERNFHKLPR